MGGKGRDRRWDGIAHSLPVKVPVYYLLHTSLDRMGSRQHVRDIKHGAPLSYHDDVRAYTREYAEALDAQDPLRHFRDEFIIPTKKDLKRKVLAADEGIFFVVFAN